MEINELKQNPIFAGKEILQSRDWKMWDSQQFHTGIPANTIVDLFQQPLGSSPSQVSNGTGTVATYKKTNYHTNNVLNAQLQKNQYLFIRGFLVDTDLVDPLTLKQLMIDAHGILQIWRGETEKVFEIPLKDVFNPKTLAISGFGATETTLQGEKLAMAFQEKTPFFFPEMGIWIPEQTTIKARIIFDAAVTFKKYSADFADVAADAADTTPFNLFVNLDCVEVRTA